MSISDTLLRDLEKEEVDIDLDPEYIALVAPWWWASQDPSGPVVVCR